jgi:hypothetical protein
MYFGDNVYLYEKVNSQNVLSFQIVVKLISASLLMDLEVLESTFGSNG